ncbi:MAG: ThuA domain-containing protein [Fimbriimonadaceae bacterium]
MWIATAVAALAIGSQSAEPLTVLVFTKTAGFRHDSIAAGVESFRRMASERGMRVEFTEDAGAFRADVLRRFRVVVFLNTSGDVLGPAQQSAFETWFRAGRGFVGIHAASDTEYEWPWYGRMLGAYFQSHPPGVHRATVTVERREHPIVSHLPRRFVHTDEWYDFRDNPRARVTVLATVNNRDYPGSTMGTDHPIVWCQEFEGSRSFYSAFGHTDETFRDPRIFEMHWRALNWVARRTPATSR